MIEKLLGLMAGYVLCRVFGDVESWFSGLMRPSSGTGPTVGPAVGPQPTMAKARATIPQGAIPAHLPAGAIPAVSPGGVPSSKGTLPRGLPSFPGSGWTFAKTTPYVVQRAWALLPTLALNQFIAEPSPDDPNKWLVYRKEPHAAGKTGVTVYTPKAAATAPAPVTVSPTYASYQASYSAAPSPALHPTIRRGSTGASVAEWQNIVGVTADGSFGPQTEAATRMWQGTHGLAPDGIVGPLTWTKALGVTA